MSQHLCIMLIKKLLRIFFFESSKYRLILILLDSQNLTKYNQSTKLKWLNTLFELEGHPHIWNSFLSSEEKEITTMHKFKAIIKSRLLFLENELAFLKRELSLFIRICDNILHLQF